MALTRKTLGVAAICAGLIGVVFTSYLTAISTLWDGLPGNDPRDHFAAQHPLRWMAMNIGFWLGVAALAAGLVLVFGKRADRRAMERDKR